MLTFKKVLNSKKDFIHINLDSQKPDSKFGEKKPVSQITQNKHVISSTRQKHPVIEHLTLKLRSHLDHRPLKVKK